MFGTKQGYQTDTNEWYIYIYIEIFPLKNKWNEQNYQTDNQHQHAINHWDMYENHKNTISYLLNLEPSKFTITRRQKSGQIIEIITLIRPFSAERLRKKAG